MIFNTLPFSFVTTNGMLLNVLQYRSHSKEENEAMDSSFRQLFVKLAGVVSGWKLSQKPSCKSVFPVMFHVFLSAICPLDHSVSHPCQL